VSTDVAGTERQHLACQDSRNAQSCETFRKQDFARLTLSVWPRSFMTLSPERVSLMRTIAAGEPVASSAPASSNATAYTLCFCPFAFTGSKVSPTCDDRGSASPTR